MPTIQSHFGQMSTPRKLREMGINARQVEVRGCGISQREFVMKTGITAPYVMSGTRKEDDPYYPFLKAHEGKVMAYTGDRPYECDRLSPDNYDKWVELTEDDWSYQWENYQTKLKFTITKAEVETLELIIQGNGTPWIPRGSRDEAKADRLKELELIQRGYGSTPNYVITDKGRDVVKYRQTKGNVDIRLPLESAKNARERKERLSVHAQKESAAALEQDVIRVLSRHLRQQASFDELADAYARLAEIKPEWNEA